MINHQFSKHFNHKTDIDFKNEEFEKALSEWIVGFIQCYPHLIIKKIESGKEVWIFKLSIDV